MRTLCEKQNNEVELILSIKDAILLEQKDHVKPMTAFDDEYEIRQLCNNFGSVLKNIRMFSLENGDPKPCTLLFYLNTIITFDI